MSIAPVAYIGIMTLHKIYDKRVVIDVSNFLDTSDCGVLVCLPQEAIPLIRSYLAMPAQWQTTYYRNIINQDYYELATDAEFAAALAVINEAIYGLQEENLMSICDLQTAIMYLADKLCECNIASGAGGGCGGSVCTPTTDEPATTEVDDPGTETPPADWEDYTEYRTYKCAQATAIVEGLLLDLSNLSIINLVGISVVSLAPLIAFTLIDPIPGDEVALIAALIISAWGIGETLAEVSYDLINSAKDDFICALYSASSVAYAEGNWATTIDAEMTSQGVATLLQPLVRGMLVAMMTNEKMNKLFTLDETKILPTGDCSGCSEACTAVLAVATNNNPQNGVYDITSATEFDFVSGQIATTHWAIWDFNTDVLSGEFCGPLLQVVDMDLTGFTPLSPAGYRLYDEDLTLLYASHTEPDWRLYPQLRRIQLKSSTAFSGSVEVTDCPEIGVYPGYGTYDGADSYSSSPYDGNHILILRLYSVDGSTRCSFATREITITGIQNFTPYANPYAYNVYEETSGSPITVYEDNVAWGTYRCGNLVILHSTTAFTIQLALGSVC